MLDAPSQEEEGEMAVVGIPQAMGGAVAHVSPSAHELRLEDNLNIAAALTVVAVDNLLTDVSRNGSHGSILQVDDIHNHGVFLQEILDGLFHFADLQSCTGDGLTVEGHLVVEEFGDELFLGSEFGSEHLVEGIADLAATEIAGGNLVVEVLHDAVGCSVIGAEESEPLALAHGTIEETEEVGQLLIESYILSVSQFMVSAILMAGDVGTGEADADHIGLIALSETFALDGSLRHLHHNLVAVGLILDFVDGEFLVDTVVIGAGPLGQFLHIIGTADEALGILVEPIGGIGAMACGKNGSTVLERDADDLGLPGGGGLQLVADGGHLKIEGRHTSGLRRGTYGLHGAVGAAIGHLAVFQEVVAGDAMDAGHSTRVQGGVTDGCHRRDVVDLAILEGIAFSEHTAEATVNILVVEAVEIVPAHLVDGDSDNKFRADFTYGSCHGGERKEAQEKRHQEISFFHNRFCFIMFLSC